MKRFLINTVLVNYLGELDQDSFEESLKNRLSPGPKYVPLISVNTKVIEHNQFQLLQVTCIHHIRTEVLSDAEVEFHVDKISKGVRENLSEELSSRKLVYNFEN